MDLTLAHDTLTNAAAWTTIVGFFAGVSALIYRVARRIEKSIGVDRDGRTLADRMERQEHRMDRVEHQLWPNGGGSLADAVHRSAEQLVETRAEVRVTRDLITKILESRAK